MDYKDHSILAGLKDYVRTGSQKSDKYDVRSHFFIRIDKADGTVWESGWMRNLTTDTASGYTNRRDFQSKVMGGGVTAVATMAGTASASGTTSLTNSGAAFPTSGQGLSGCIVAAGPNASGTGSTVFGMITTNSATVLTVDRWYTAGNPGNSTAATTPNATATYQVLPGGMPAMFLAISSDAGAPASSDTTMVGELTSNGFSRVIGTYSHSAAATTYVNSAVYTCSGGSTTIQKYCAAGSIVASTGVMPFESTVPSPPTLVSGDQLTLTDTITIN
jgi:hypothetical protein